MRILKKWQLLSLLIANALTVSACTNSNADDKKVNDNKNLQQKTEIGQQTVQPVNTKLQSELDRAKRDGKAVFVVVMGTGSMDTEKAIEIAKGAVTIYKNAVIAQLDRDDAANAQLVDAWRLSGAPLPIILVLSTKGLLSGGFILSQATADKIASLVPTPKMEEVYTAIGLSKPSIVVFTKKSFADRNEVIKNAQVAVVVLNDEAVFVEVDMNDPDETGFMNQLSIDKSTNASITIVFNKLGQVVETSTTIPEVEKLVTAAKTPVKKTCGPSCGSKGC
ncbi:MAG: hypothetical protein HOO91_11445 [Bacteroidales bacterium]|nr:hypothetical protein [Bacteroidales bacterium]